MIYGYWPWGQAAPKYRKSGLIDKKALLISSSAAPGLIGRWLYASGRQLHTAAKTIGAKSIGLLFSGMVSQQAQPLLSARTVTAATSMVHRLLSE